MEFVLLALHQAFLFTIEIFETGNEFVEKDLFTHILFMRIFNLKPMFGDNIT